MEKKTFLRISYVTWQRIWIFVSMLPVVAIAAYQSYWHIHDVAYEYGTARDIKQAEILAHLSPLSVDGLVMAGYVKNRAAIGKLTIKERIYCIFAVYGGLLVSLVANMTASDFKSVGHTAIAGWPALAMFLGIKVLGTYIPIEGISRAMARWLERKSPTPEKPTPPVKATRKPAQPKTPTKAATSSRKKNATPPPSAPSGSKLFKAAVIDESADGWTKVS